MKLLLKHGMKLTVANLLGLLVYFFLASLLHVGYYVLIFVSVLGTVGGMKLFTDISLDGDQIDGLVGSIVFVPVILFSLIKGKSFTYSFVGSDFFWYDSNN